MMKILAISLCAILMLINLLLIISLRCIESGIFENENKENKFVKTICAIIFILIIVAIAFFIIIIANANAFSSEKWLLLNTYISMFFCLVSFVKQIKALIWRDLYLAHHGNFLFSLSLAVLATVFIQLFGEISFIK